MFPKKNPLIVRIHLPHDELFFAICVLLYQTGIVSKTLVEVITIVAMSSDKKKFLKARDFDKGK